MNLKAKLILGFVLVSVMLLVSMNVRGPVDTFESKEFQSYRAQSREVELDAYWDEVVRVVEAGDTDGYGSTFHEDGVLVTQGQQTSYPLTKALAGWKKGLDNTKEGKNKVSLDFQFSKRWGDETTAHETGIFKHVSTDVHGNKKEKIMHFEALLVKVNNKWRLLMEYQKTQASRKEWNALKER